MRILRATLTLAATLALAAGLGAAPSAGADELAPVKRVSCPSVAQVNQHADPTLGKVTYLAAMVDSCTYYKSKGTSQAPTYQFTFAKQATPAEAKAAQLKEWQDAGAPVVGDPFRPAPAALGAGALMWADAGPSTFIWQFTPGVTAIFGSAWNVTSGVELAKLFRPMMEVYTVPGTRTVNGRQWRTECEPYSATARCRTEIWATVITRDADGAFKRTDGWAFNSLTYRWSPRILWAANPLAAYGEIGGATTWTSTDGRKWRTECDTPATGAGSCRSYLYVTVYSQANGRFSSSNQWVFNNQVLYSG